MAGVLAVEEAEIVDGEVVDEPLDGECQLVEGEVISGVSPIGIIDRLPRDLEHCHSAVASMPVATGVVV